MKLPNLPFLSLVLAVGMATVACKPAAKDVPAAPAAAPATAAVPAEATPGTPAPAPAAASSVADLDKIPQSQVALPPFPYIDYPASIPVGLRLGGDAALDQTSVIVGNTLHTVTGRYKVTHFSNSDAELSKFQALRDYREAATRLGGVKVNLTTPDDEALEKATSLDAAEIAEKLRYEHGLSYDAYVINTPAGRAWIIVMVSEETTRIVSILEQQVASSVKLVKADAIKSELDARGRIALYVNFDTDKAVLQPDGIAAVAEIADVMKRDPSLQLSIEGHTDNSGDAKRNMALSQERAQAVVERLRSSGIDQGRLAAKGHGAQKPLADNGSEAGKAKNRRVELVKVSPKSST